ncbi:MAG: response regulator transcription factor [Gloeotrichia echinulata GP01]
MSEEYYELSPREAEVFDLLLKGMSNKEISQELYVSRRTAENFVASILAKTGRKTRQKLAAQVKRESIKIGHKQPSTIYVVKKKDLHSN